MKISLSVIADNRRFYKVFARLRPKLDGLLRELMQLGDETETVLVSLTDVREKNHLEIIPNRNGFFQVVVGASGCVSDEEILQHMLDSVGKAIALYKRDNPEAQLALSAVDRWEPLVLRG